MFVITDVASVCAFRLTMHGENKLVGIGTGFLFLHKSNTYLVTARHNLTRRNAITGGPLAQEGKEHLTVVYPTQIGLRLPYEVQHEHEKQAYDAQPCVINIWNKHCPIWRVHDPEDLTWDVAVIDLGMCCSEKIIECPKDDDQSIFLSETKLLVRSYEFLELKGRQNIRLASITNYLSDGFPLRVGADVFVLGYPRGIETGKGLPIWKRATIASEPMEPVNEYPIILIDTATRQGMSGGLVIARQNRGAVELPRGTLSLMNGEVARLVGVYTSRDSGTDEFEAQVGRVWTRDHIVDVIEHGLPEKSRF